jgi:4-amino-4-deoxy-L-arabinose transferase-like glycosyltransferase
MRDARDEAWRGRGPRLALAAAALLGCALSVGCFDPSPEPHHDEAVYVRYCRFAGAEGIGAWPSLVRAYTAEMQRGDPVVLPPTRALYPVAGAALHRVAGVGEHRALALVSLFAAMLTMGAAAFLARAMLWPREGVAAVWLMACAPLRLALGSKAMIDGFFGLLALAAIAAAWRALHRPGSRGAQAAFGLSLAALVLTKENAAFTWLGLVAAMAAGPRLGLPRPSPGMWRAAVLGPAAGAVALTLLAGGWSPLVEAMGTFVVKVRRNPFTVLACDGPWYRVLLDLFILHPALLLLAFAGLAALRRDRPGPVFLAAVTVTGLAALSCVKYGASLRYTTAAEFPLRALACVGLAGWTAAAGRGGRALFVGGALLLGALDLRQHELFFREKQMYEPTPVEMMRATRVLKSVDDVRRELGRGP